MNPEQKQFLSLERRPARLTTEQAAWLLGFNAHDIPILVPQVCSRRSATSPSMA